MPISAAVAAGASRGAVVPIASYKFIADGGAYGPVVFSGIPQIYQHLLLVTACRDQASSVSVYNPMSFNGVSSGYSETQLTGNGVSAATSRWANQSFFQFTQQTAESSAKGIYSANEIHILNYTNTSVYKSVLTRNCYELNGAGSTALIGGTWASTAAITSIRIDPNIGFKAGSTFNLYGIRSTGQ